MIYQKQKINRLIHCYFLSCLPIDGGLIYLDQIMEDTALEQLLAGGRIRARATGAGRLVVLLHSLLADAASWDALVPLLAGDARVVVFDLPGFAGLPAITGGLRPVAAAIGDAIDELRIESGSTAPLVVGNGYGSFLALRLALDRPQSVGALALLGCGARFSDPGRSAFRAMREAATARGLEAIAETAMARLFGTAFREANPELMDARRRAFLRTSPETFAAACSALETLDIEAEVGRIGVPALLMVGAEDQATPPAMAEDLARRLPHASLLVFDGLAHVPQMQDPERVGAALLEFAEQNAIQGPAPE